MALPNLPCTQEWPEDWILQKVMWLAISREVPYITLLGNPSPAVCSMCWLCAESTRGVGSPREWQNSRMRRAWVGKSVPCLLHVLPALLTAGWWLVQWEACTLKAPVRVSYVLWPKQQPCHMYQISTMHPKSMSEEEPHNSPLWVLLSQGTWSISDKESQTYSPFVLRGKPRGHYGP